MSLTSIPKLPNIPLYVNVDPRSQSESSSSTIVGLQDDITIPVPYRKPHLKVAMLMHDHRCFQPPLASLFGVLALRGACSMMHHRGTCVSWWWLLWLPALSTRYLRL